MTSAKDVKSDTTDVESVSTKEEEANSSTLVQEVHAGDHNETLDESVKQSEIKEDDLVSLNGKKSDHSSDESSYVVVENEATGDIAKTEDVNDENEVEDALNEKDETQTTNHNEQLQSDSFQDPNESMVVVDEVLEKSSTSYYTSADESVNNEDKPDIHDSSGDEKCEKPKESTSNDSIGNERTLSTCTTEADESVVFVGEEKSGGKLEDSVIFMGEEKTKNKELEMSVDLSSWQTTEEVSSEANIAGSGQSSWIEVTGEPSQESLNQEQIKTEESRNVDTQDGEVINKDNLTDTDMPSIERMTEVLTLCQNNPSTVTRDDLGILAAILSKKSDTALQASVLDSLVRVSAFTQHNVSVYLDFLLIEKKVVFLNPNYGVKYFQ